MTDSEFLLDAAQPSHATLVLAHGAGAPMDTPFMTTIAEQLAAAGVTVLRFEFPYMQRLRREARRLPPNPLRLLSAHFREVVATVGDTPLFVGGKSLGGRVATHIADELGVAGVIALGYPFHPAKQPDKLRVEHLRTLRSPCLIVQGTRDALGSREDVASYALSASVRLHWLADGDHSFVPRKASGRTLSQNLEEAVAAIDAFTRRHSP